MLEEYLSIDSQVSAEIIVKKSRFISNMYPAEGIKQAMYILDKVNKKNRTANHNVFAYVVFNNNMLYERFSDDGEPSHTAGMPILDIIRANKLINILVVVTRYFGGILLGSGGLVRAYSDSTKEALKRAILVKSVMSKGIELTISYDSLNKVLYEIKAMRVLVEDKIYTDKVLLRIFVKRDLVDQFINIVSNITNNDYNLKDMGFSYKKLDV